MYTTFIIVHYTANMRVLKVTVPSSLTVSTLPRYVRNANNVRQVVRMCSICVR